MRARGERVRSSLADSTSKARSRGCSRGETLLSDSQQPSSCGSRPEEAEDTLPAEPPIPQSRWEMGVASRQARGRKPTPSWSCVVLRPQFA